MIPLKRNSLSVWLFGCLLGFSLPGEPVLRASPLDAEDPVEAASRVIILANSSDPESVSLAQHYAEKRAVPRENIVALPMPGEETIRWPVFIETVYQPLQDELVRRGWIDAMLMDGRDKIGRKRYVVAGHKISYLVVCRGVPLRIDHDSSLYADTPPYTRQAELRVNSAALDAELALLARAGSPINGLLPNPLFRNDRPIRLQRAQVVRVARLDGPSQAAAMALVDHAITAERTGLIGRAYVDIGGPHPEGDRWFESVARMIRELGFDLSVNREPGQFTAGERFDAPVLYFGWYSGKMDGPFTREGFRFPAGAIALHLHSFSAVTLRSQDAAWTGPLVGRGVTATFGNVYEPYLTFTHHPHLLLRSLAEGHTLGEATFYALPALSWECVMVGDPLYRPFARSFATQWEHRSELPPELLPYVVLRQARLLEHAGQSEQAVQVLEQALTERPGLVLALGAADILSRNGKQAGAISVLNKVVADRARSSVDADLLLEAARFFATHGAPAQALDTYKLVLADPTLGPLQKLHVLPAALESARKSGAADLAAVWQSSLEALNTDAGGDPKK